MWTKYGKIAHEIREAIARGDYPPGSKLPAIPELMATYGVARDTVRDAIATLANEGLVVPQSGIGTVVRETTNVNLNSSLSAPHPTWDVTAGDDAKTVLVVTGWTTADAEISERLAIEPGTDVLRRVKHYYKGRNVALTHEQWLPADVVRDIADRAAYDAANQSATEPADLYTMMRTAGHVPAETTEVVTARMPDPDEKDTMGVPAGIPVLLTSRVTRDPAGRPLETSNFAGPSDRTAQTYTVAIPTS